MRVLYVIETLLERHDVRVVASGTAFKYLSERLPRVDEVSFRPRSTDGFLEDLVSTQVLSEFVDRLDEYGEKLGGYEQDGNTVALETIEGKITEAAEDDRRERRKLRREARRAVK